MLQEWCVKVHSKSLVVPNVCDFDNSNQYVYPSAFDQLLRRVTSMQRVLFYKPEEVVEFCEFVEVLKRGLAEALVVFSPLAGRLEIDNESGLPRILCNGAGVEFLEASIDAKLEDFGADLQPRDIPLEKLFSDFRPAVDATDTPLLSVQVRAYLHKVDGALNGGFILFAM